MTPVNERNAEDHSNTRCLLVLIELRPNEHNTLMLDYYSFSKSCARMNIGASGTYDPNKVTFSQLSGFITQSVEQRSWIGILLNLLEFFKRLKETIA